MASRSSSCLDLPACTANKSAQVTSGAREIAVIWALNIGFSKTGTEMWLNFTPDEARDEQESDKCSYFWKSHLGSLRVMPSSPAHFKTNWRAFEQKHFSIHAADDQVFKIFWFSSRKEYSISIFYLTSSDSNPVHHPHHLILNFTRTPTINQINPLTAVPHTSIWYLSVHPHTWKPTLVIALTPSKSLKDHLQTMTYSSTILELFDLRHLGWLLQPTAKSSCAVQHHTWCYIAWLKKQSSHRTLINSNWANALAFLWH